MKTTDLFKNNRSSRRLNESMEKTFGKKLNLESFDLPRLEDTRNKLRTQLSQVRSESGFNENLENDAYTQAQWMLDAINSEIAEREEFISDPSVAEVSTDEGADSLENQVAMLLKRFDENMNEIGGYGDPDQDKIVELLKQGDVDGATEIVWYAYADQDGGELRNMDSYIEDLEDEFGALVQDGADDEGGDTDDSYALASAGHGAASARPPAGAAGWRGRSHAAGRDASRARGPSQVPRDAPQPSGEGERFPHRGGAQRPR
jgi:hypothetical protein